MEYIKMDNGIKLPVQGYGTLNIPLKDTKQCILNALKQGYRLIDSAASYFNEEIIGEAIKESLLPREDIVITSKVWIQDAGYENTLRAFYTSLKKLDVDYMDVYLIHQPYGDYYGSWRAMEELYLQGKVKVIGVCNFSAERFVDLCLNAKISPMINQVEIHPFFQQSEFIHIMNQYKCIVQAWGPLVEGQKNIFHNPILQTIADKHQKTIPQVILRWHYQRGIITIPKTIQKNRMKENIDIFDFVLDQEDMDKIKSMDIGYSEIINHQSYKTAKWLNQYQIHE